VTPEGGTPGALFFHKETTVMTRPVRFITAAAILTLGFSAIGFPQRRPQTP